jgi:hypothetical protein
MEASASNKEFWDSFVERLSRQQRKRVVRVTYAGPTKIPCKYCGTPFLSLSDCHGRYPEYHSNACEQKAYRERKKAVT